MRKSSYFFITILITMLCMGCSTANTPNPVLSKSKEQKPYEPPRKEYVFQIGDVFDVKFFEYPEFDLSVTVRPDGKISVPLVEDLTVAGMSPSTLDKIITERYREKLKEPEITIIVREFSGQTVYVGGEVNNPGVLKLTGEMTLVQSIFQAGNYKRTAKLNNVAIIRKGSNEVEFFKVNLKAILDNEGKDFMLQPYDVIYVPKTVIAGVNDFVDQYINKIIPDVLRVGFNFIYDMNKTTRVTTTVAP